MYKARLIRDKIFCQGTAFILTTYIRSLFSFSSPYQHVPTRNSLQKYQSDDQIPPTNENESLQQVPSRNSQNIVEDEMLYDDSSSNPERCSSSSSMASQALTDQVQISSILNVIIIQILNYIIKILNYKYNNNSKM